MTKAARFSSQFGAYLIALTAADVVFSILQFPLMLRNIPDWGVMLAMMFFLQWPVMLFISVLPFLAALSIQRSTHAVSAVIFLVTGGLIGLLCSVAMYLLYFRNASDDPDGLDPVFYAIHTGAIAIVAGIVGAYVYRRMTISCGPTIVR